MICCCWLLKMMIISMLLANASAMSFSDRLSHQEVIQKQHCDDDKEAKTIWEPA